jgi:hypothetical protein
MIDELMTVLFYPMLPNFRNSIAFFGRFPGFARLSFWYEQHEDVRGALVE